MAVPYGLGLRLIRRILLAGNLCWLIPAVLASQDRPATQIAVGVLAGGFLTATWASTNDGFLPTAKPATTRWIWLLTGLAAVLLATNGAAATTALLYPALVAAWMMEPGAPRAAYLVGGAIAMPAFTLLDGVHHWSPGPLFGLVATLASNLAAARYTRILREGLLEQEDLVRMAKLNERQHILRELHDIMGQELTLIALDADSGLRNEESRAKVLHDISRRSTSVLADIGTFVRGAEDISLKGELNRAAAAFGVRGVACHIAVPELSHPDSAVGRLMAHVVREATTNVLRHAPQAANCWISIEESPTEVHLKIVNDGNTSRAISPGFGLLGMQDRVDRHHGKLSVQGSEEGLFILRALLLK